jgi:hypothetical protein
MPETVIEAAGVEELKAWHDAGAQWARRLDYAQLRTLGLGTAVETTTTGRVVSAYIADWLRGTWLSEGQIADMGLDPEGVRRQPPMLALVAGMAKVWKERTAAGEGARQIGAEAA